MAGLSLTGAFAGAQLRAPAPAARVSHTGFSVVAVRAFRRSHLFPSRDRRIASAHARRARGGTPSDRRERARGGARVRRRCSASRRVPRDGARAPEDPARRAHPRARLRSGLGSGCTLRSRDVEDKMRPTPEGPQGTLVDAPRSRRRRVPRLPNARSTKRSPISTRPLTARASPSSSLAAPPVCRRRSGKSRRSTRTATPFAIPCT
jgi:hypothetical protein